MTVIKLYGDSRDFRSADIYVLIEQNCGGLSTFYLCDYTETGAYVASNICKSKEKVKCTIDRLSKIIELLPEDGTLTAYNNGLAKTLYETNIRTVKDLKQYIALKNALSEIFTNVSITYGRNYELYMSGITKDEVVSSYELMNIINSIFSINDEYKLHAFVATITENNKIGISLILIKRGGKNE